MNSSLIYWLQWQVFSNQTKDSSILLFFKLIFSFIWTGTCNTALLPRFVIDVWVQRCDWLWNCILHIHCWFLLHLYKTRRALRNCSSKASIFWFLWKSRQVCRRKSVACRLTLDFPHSPIWELPFYSSHYNLSTIHSWTKASEDFSSVLSLFWWFSFSQSIVLMHIITDSGHTVKTQEVTICFSFKIIVR